VTKEKLGIKMKIERRIGYETAFDRMVYRATVRVYSTGNKERPPQDIALIRVRSLNPQGLEKKIKRIQTRFMNLLKKNPKFIEQLGEIEDILIGEI